MSLVIFFSVPVCAFPGVRLLSGRLSSNIMLMSQNTIQIKKTKTDGLWKGEYQLLSQQLLWLKVSLLASEVECSIFSTRPPPMLERILYILTTWYISILMKTKMLHSANMFMRKEYWFNIYILPSKICTFCKLFFLMTQFCPPSNPLYRHMLTKWLS